MKEDPSNSTARLEAVSKIINDIKLAYPDAKVLNVNIDFEYARSLTAWQANALVPKVRIQVER